MRGILSAAAAFAAIIGSSNAQSVELRIVERTGRTAVTGPVDAELNIAVQARVVGGAQPFGLGAFGFDLHIVGEAESNGTLVLGLISNPDHTYTTVFGTSAAIGRGGLASQYVYLAGVNPSFNGVINQSSGTFTNTADQEIGLVAGSAFGQSLLNTPGLDADSNGHPDTWVGNGSGTNPASGTTAPFDPAIAPVYFGWGGSWVDVYRFRYTITNFPARTLVFHLQGMSAIVCANMTFSNGLWGTSGNGSHPLITASDLSIPVITSGPGACCDGASGACTIVTAPECVGVFLSTPTCSPNPCPPAGRCCNLVGGCASSLQSLCNNEWDLAGSCTPNPCPQQGPCCSAGGACSTSLQSVCTGMWSQSGSCSPNICPRPGACCAGFSGSGSCSFIAPAFCTFGVWSAASSCTPSPCNGPIGACCNNATASCTNLGSGNCSAVTSTFLGAGVACTANVCPRATCCSNTTGSCGTTGPTGVCPAGFTRRALGTCSPNPCPQLGRCCAVGGACSVGFSSACSSFWITGGTCTAGACPAVGSCCSATGACTLLSLASCGTAPFHAGLACGTPSNRIGCCPANFNQVNGVDVQDIYDFLAAWFSHDSHADFDQDGTLSILDVTQFINAWTAVCP